MVTILLICTSEFSSVSFPKYIGLGWVTLFSNRCAALSSLLYPILISYYWVPSINNVCLH